MPGPEIQAAGEQGLEERLEVAVDGAEREAGRGQGPHQRVPVQMRGTRTRLVEMNWRQEAAWIYSKTGRTDQL